ncbi:hypothetical protein L2E82_18515 [Cichorium intybus]|uniref:Uncharacterized protein n=1 Tax=Cichorium intybus TaxID=13427 RepID=A0ACB9F9P5_CICIN|nr:hypothetical protein L2E82_18515 [Cichorium intybus]
MRRASNLCQAARQEATGPTIEVGDDGLQEVDVVQTLKGYATAKYLIESGYRMTEVVNVLLETPLPITVEQLSQCDEEVDVVAETQQHEFIVETQPSKQKLKSRKKSERILNAKLIQIKGGPGSTSGDPYTLELVGVSDFRELEYPFCNLAWVLGTFSHCESQ